MQPVARGHLLKKYIALAHVKNEYSDLDTILDFEIKIEHFKKTTTARIVNTPFFNPERKRSCPLGMLSLNHGSLLHLN